MFEHRYLKLHLIEMAAENYGQRRLKSTLDLSYDLIHSFHSLQLRDKRNKRKEKVHKTSLVNFPFKFFFTKTLPLYCPQNNTAIFFNLKADIAVNSLSFDPIKKQEDIIKSQTNNMKITSFSFFSDKKIHPSPPNTSRNKITSAFLGKARGQWDCNVLPEL